MAGRHQPPLNANLQRLRAELAGLKVETELVRWAPRERKAGFKPAQSRTPADSGRESARWNGGLAAGARALGMMGRAILDDAMQPIDA